MRYKTILECLLAVCLCLLASAAAGELVPDSHMIENGSHQIYTEAYIAKPGEKSSELVLYIPGQGDAISMYEYLADTFIRKYGRDVLLYDVRGQGKSSGPRCHIDDYREHLSDFDLVLQHARRDYEKIHVIAHSTGALIASLYTLEGFDVTSVASITAISPFFGLPGPSLYRRFAGVASAFGSRSLGLGQTQVLPFNPSIYVSTKDNNLLTHDPEFFERFNGHPEKCGTPTFAWVQASLAAHERLRQLEHQASVPLLMLTAGSDGVVSTQAAKQQCVVWNAANQVECTYHEYPGMRHGLVYEIEEVREDLFHKIGELSIKIPAFMDSGARKHP
ncbi:MAG: alpha/beta fold hydrolase [Oligoflexales bacterium]|nr:alpha/beta fold hydrolase [Oligoflexales bacterium]